MNTQTFDAVTRRAAEGISRRRSLLTLGGAAAAATIARPSASEAKKKKGKNCKKKEKQRCNKDAAACKTTILVLCDPADPATCTMLQNCCDGCSASTFITCLIATIPV
ncbi:MAG: hypothetical protein M3Z20_04330 [Chloroflexota bacterium]|nr:hypothetical protein [Chloroflexota bacterium]